MRGIAAALFFAAFAAQAEIDLEQRRQEVAAAERAFAKTMADRDYQAFMGFVAEDAVFLNGGQPLRGKAAIGAHWQQFFKPDTPAPFAWGPDLVDVVMGGELGHSEGPVTNLDGQPIARFTSTWRREADGEWRIVFDNGACLCAKPEAAAE